MSAQLMIEGLGHLFSLHSRHSSGIAMAQKSPNRWREYSSVFYDEAVQTARDLVGADDSYLAVNAFRPFENRCVERLTHLTGNFVDCDFYKVGLNLDQALNRIDAKCESLGLQTPTLTISSGRGCYLIWLFDKPLYVGSELDPNKKKKLISGWYATQSMLIDAFAEVAADRNCAEAARLLRLVGSINSRSREKVYTFDSGDRVKKPSSLLSTLRAAQPKQPKKSAVKPKSSIKRTQSQSSVTSMMNERTLNLTRMDDFRRVAELRGGKLTDHRARSIFYYAVAASHFYHEIDGVLRSVADFMECCIDSGNGKYDSSRPEKYLTTVLKRFNAKRQAIDAGNRFEAHNINYKARNKTIIDALDITTAEQKELSTIIGKAEKYERKNKKRREKARAAGAKERALYEAESLARTKPWEAEGISERTYYRRREKLGKPVE